jgi:hypothetical protein
LKFANQAGRDHNRPRFVRRFLSLLVAFVIALIGVVALLLFLQSRDDPTLDRPPITHTQPMTQQAPLP